MDKPTCRKCGGHHWPFVACEKAVVANENEAVNAAAKARQAELAKVHPIFRSPQANPGADRLRNFRQIAPNVFARIREDDQPPEAA